MISMKDKVQVNIPYTLLKKTYLDRFLDNRLNPEIGLDWEALEGYSKKEVTNIYEKIKQRGLSVTLHGPFEDLSPGSADPDVRALTRRRFEELLAFVPLLKPKTVVCHAGYDERRYWYHRERWIERSLETWLWLGEKLKNEGAALMLENVYEKTPDDILVLLQSLEPTGTGFCLDTGHQAVFGQVSLHQWVDTLGPYLGEVHLHDNNQLKDEHLALGEGSIDFQDIFVRLKNLSQRPPVVTLEPHYEEHLWPSLRYLARIWPW